MRKKPRIVETIGVLISLETKRPQAIQLLRQFTTESIATINAKISAGEPVCTRVICNEEFYTGIREFMQMVDSLESHGVQHQLTRNAAVENRAYFESIVHRLNNLTLEDFR